MVGNSGKKVAKVLWSSRSVDAVAAQSAHVKSPRYPVSNSSDDATGSLKDIGVANLDSSSEIEGESEYSPRFPPLLFAYNCYPVKLRLNIYSKAHVIGSIAKTLAGSDHLDTILQSQFGRLFELPVAHCHNSTKLVGNLVCRQLVTDRKYELWFHFAAHRLRFSLDEFQQITGLNCGAFDAADSEDDVDPGSAMWQQLFDISLGTLPLPKFF